MNQAIQNVINEAHQILAKSGIKNSRYETFLITQKSIKKSYLEIVINPGIIISDHQKNCIMRNILDRSMGKPISKIFGIKEFFSNEFFVNNNVLDPRPETELLVEVAIKQCLKLRKNFISLLDLGLGSGCVIISILKQLPMINFEALGVDFCEATLQVAKENIKKFDLERFLKIEESDWFSSIRSKYDIIVSNPPYIPTSEIPSLDKCVRIYDPFLALNGGSNGLQAYEIISDNAKFYLNDGGVILVEIGFGQLEAVKYLFKMKGFTTILEEKDLQGINRVVGFTINK